MNKPQQKINSSTEESKGMVALIGASITPSLLLSVYAFVIHLLDNFENTTLQVLSNSIGAGLFVFIVSFIHTFFLGMPLFLLASRYKLIKWWTILIGSFIVGSTPCTILSFLYNKQLNNFSSSIDVAGIMGLWGLSGGFTFWLLWLYWISATETHLTS